MTPQEEIEKLAELMVEVERLREALNHAIDRLDHVLTSDCANEYHIDSVREKAQEALSTPTPPGLGVKMLEMVRAGIIEGLEGNNILDVQAAAQAFTPEDLEFLGINP